MSSNDELVPSLQHVTVQDQRIGLIEDRTVQIGQPQVRNRPGPLEHRAEPACFELKVAADERTINDKTNVIELDNII